MGWDATFTTRCVCVSTGTVGGADGSAGEDPAGAGHHQAASVLHSAVSAREGPPSAQPSPGQTQAAPGDSGDEVSHTFLCTLTRPWAAPVTSHLISFLDEIPPFFNRMIWAAEASERLFSFLRQSSGFLYLGAVPASAV